MKFVSKHVSHVNAKNRTSRLNCFIEFESIFPTSSTRVAANQKTATALSSDIFCARIDVSGASSRELYGWAWWVQMQYMRCLIHLIHDIENCTKYATNVEQSFRSTSGPSEVSMHWINQLMSVWSRARASTSSKDFLNFYSVNEIKPTP
jgi:hypothetical protein